MSRATKSDTWRRDRRPRAYGGSMLVSLVAKTPDHERGGGPDNFQNCPSYPSNDTKFFEGKYKANGDTTSKQMAQAGGGTIDPKC